MSQSIYIPAPNQTREQDLAQAEFEAYIEAQAQAIAPEPEIMFIDINDTYDFKCYVGDEIIALISFDISNTKNIFRGKRCGVCKMVIRSRKQVCCSDSNSLICKKCCHHPDPTRLNSGSLLFRSRHSTEVKQAA